MDFEQVKRLAQELGFASDSQRLQLLEEVFNPEVRERLTIVRDDRTLAHLAYMRMLADWLGEYGNGISSLYELELDLRMSTKGVSLDRFASILEQQNAQEITVRNEPIPSQVTEKPGLIRRLFGGGGSD